MPSWFWTAWKGGFSFGFREVAQVKRGRHEKFCETSPVTQWSTSSDSSGSNRRRIRTDWHVDRMSAEHQDKPLPDGWTRMETRVAFKRSWEQMPRPIFWKPIVYRHQSSKIEETTFWYYPFRMPEISNSTPFEVPEQTRYLFCKTWKASVLLCNRWDQEEASYDSFKRGLWANDLDLRGEKPRIGRLWLHHAQQFVEETDGLADETEGEARIARIYVVAISRSSCSGKRRFEFDDEKQRPFKDRINILWVKWDKGIAYRVASGYVYEEDWNRLDLEEIDLILG